MRTILIIIALSITPAAQAGFAFWETPTPDYLASTTKIEIGHIPIGETPVNSVTDGFQTLTFSAPLGRRNVPDGWETWGELPFVESVNPEVLFHVPGNGFAIMFDVPVSAFGLEISGNPWAWSEYQVTYLTKTRRIVGINQYVYTTNGILHGNNGARLFAASDHEHPFAGVLISGLTDDEGFAIAQIRYTAVPEQSSYLMIVQAVAMVAVVRWKRMKRGAK